MCVKVVHPELTFRAIIRRFDNDQHGNVQVSLRLHILDVQLADELSTEPDESYTDDVLDLQEDELCFLQSTQAELLFPQQDDPHPNYWVESRLPETLLRRWEHRAIESAEQGFVKKYLHGRLPHQGVKANDSRALRIALLGKPQIILAGTISMVEGIMSRVLDMVSHLIIDEGSDIWWHFIGTATRFTPIVTPAFLEAVQENFRFQRDHSGLLIAPGNGFISEEHWSMNKEFLDRIQGS
ncbi:unnamed protein product [Gongylonema pulchrum]|uniref:Helicase C-terminal domain-containing protein n=1 Tax=Gongylonema pulchrum TaxID=637853 RepID=A0A183ES00_9BILA|nr:unnamed protein product [Gongylonema pulchrum]